ncbi:enoyl-CoA hydratase/isomerase family protein [Psychrobacillus sp. NPDC096623]|uniref:enoyl-CoA hydratase/isomerase family protein n=1 Tax=Psychrobacillus sp. NPDC096623 TaxID=3364492 RepID=UPI0037F34582
MINMQVIESICILTIDKAPMNTLDKLTITQLEDAISKITEDSSVRTVVITGAGEKAFVAGAEISEFLECDALSGEELVRKGQQVFKTLESLPIPVIAAINGYALGAGLELALACDIRIIEEQAQVGLPETGLGLIPGYGGTQRLARLVGIGHAKELIFSGRYIKADEALKLGVVEKVVATGTSMESALAMAEIFKRKAPLAIGAAKKAIQEGIDLPLKEAIEIEISYCGKLFGSEDLQEGAKAFFDRREANFIGS